ncbi:MAG: PhoPQ-activated pathogenicity-related family protein [Verrucomicrobia bacterium]|nr:PhoPQ-activated pathogenicity-related family protein [Verrucomicrobiota bacterium]
MAKSFLITRITFLFLLLAVASGNRACSLGAQVSNLRAGIAAAASSRAGSPEPTALDRYVAAPDSNYSYRLVSTHRGQGYVTCILEMTSQSWLTTNEVDRTLWKHWLAITRPDAATGSTALLFIGGGSNEKEAPKQADGNMIRVALATKSVVSELRLVPNQPLVFAGDGQKRSEDALIAYCWDKYLRTGDERWPTRLPMTKSAVRAMDTVTAFCATKDGGELKIDSFVVAGGSKRGWTTWTTAAVDRRVAAIVPIVIDVLNIEPSMMHHWEAYGFYSPAIGDYEIMGIMDWQGTKEYRNLMKIEEPFEYRDRLTLPKFIINATGDQFFLPDSSRFYFHDLPGIKYLRYVPNADHSLKDTDALETLVACYGAILNQTSLPRFSWKFDRDATMRVEVMDKPTAVKLWQATNPNARDFRLETIGKAWTSTDLAAQNDGVYLAKVAPPEKGWTACLVELTYASQDQPAPFKFTTEVRVVPDALPYKFKAKNHPAAAGGP